MGDLKVVQEFIKVLLQWNYGEMFQKVGDGGGIVENLPSVPKKFQGLEVCSRPVRLVKPAPPSMQGRNRAVCRATEKFSR